MYTFASMRKLAIENNLEDTQSTKENCTGDDFCLIFDGFMMHQPFRNLTWAKGVYAVLNDDCKTITMYYQDANSETLDHESVRDCFSVADLAGEDWILVYNTRKNF